jgi:uncharacterized protein (TIGR02217 family)
MTDGFDEIQFPPAIGQGATGGPGFLTLVSENNAGFEKRLIQWSAAKAKYNVGTGIKNRADMDLVLQFFFARMGRAYGFRFKDWADYQIVNQQFATGDGTTAVFQLTKIYTSGGRAYARLIRKPVAAPALGVTDFWVSGVPVAWTADWTTGLVTFTTPPANTAPIVCHYAEFDVPVRFDDDSMQAQSTNYQVGQWDRIMLVEIRT